jgi:hypothetical protein
MERTQRWSDLTPRQRAAIVAAGTIEVVLITVAIVDLARRPRAQVRGSKLLWLVGCFIQPIGPVAYLRFGRRTR